MVVFAPKQFKSLGGGGGGQRQLFVFILVNAYRSCEGGRRGGGGLVGKLCWEVVSGFKRTLRKSEGGKGESGGGAADIAMHFCGNRFMGRKTKGGGMVKGCGRCQPKCTCS